MNTFRLQLFCQLSLGFILYWTLISPITLSQLIWDHSLFFHWHIWPVSFVFLSNLFFYYFFHGNMQSLFSIQTNLSFPASLFLVNPWGQQQLHLFVAEIPALMTLEQKSCSLHVFGCGWLQCIIMFSVLKRIKLSTEFHKKYTLKWMFQHISVWKCHKSKGRLKLAAGKLIKGVLFDMWLSYIKCVPFFSI